MLLLLALGTLFSRFVHSPCAVSRWPVCRHTILASAKSAGLPPTWWFTLAPMAELQFPTFASTPCHSA
jgi:hypothetical protein